MAERMEQHLTKMTTVLDLTATQQEQIKEILAERKQQQQAQRELRQEDHQQMQELKSAAKFDEAAFRALAEKRAEKRIDMQVERMKTKQQIVALLTPEQQEKAEVLFQTMGERGPGHGHGMMH
jgi:Spy/CpxP family protein refolding chaperone